MRPHEPFRIDDLEQLDDRLLGAAVAVEPMCRIAEGICWPRVIGLRHDVDNWIEPAVEFAEWEAERGYRSTYFVLHTAAYWRDKPLLRRSLDRIAALGHEIGLHNNAIADTLTNGRDPAAVLADAVAELRRYGHDVVGTVAHGDPLCRDEHGQVRFVNDELFVECARPELGPPDRWVGGRPLRPVPLAEFGFAYDSNWLPRAEYLSDSGGAWSRPFDEVADGFPFPGQLHVLIHPDWWRRAFTRLEVPA